MNGCTTKDFNRKLRKLNPLLRVDHERIAWTHPEYPECGLYYGTQYLYGVPQYFVPTYSIAGVNFEVLKKRDEFETIKYLDKYGFCPPGKENLEEVLWRGAKAILTDLARRGLIDIKAACREFNLELFLRCPEYPRNYVQHVTS